MPRVVCPLRHLWNQKDSCGSEREAVGVESIALLAEANRGTEVDDKIVPSILTHAEREVALSGLHGLIWKGHCFVATNAATVSPTSPPPPLMGVRQALREESWPGFLSGGRYPQHSNSGNQHDFTALLPRNLPTNRLSYEWNPDRSEADPLQLIP